MMTVKEDNDKESSPRAVTPPPTPMRDTCFASQRFQLLTHVFIFIYACVCVYVYGPFSFFFLCRVTFTHSIKQAFVLFCVVFMIAWINIDECG
jgi:hypothetical protein